MIHVRSGQTLEVTGVLRCQSLTVHSDGVLVIRADDTCRRVGLQCAGVDGVTILPGGRVEVWGLSYAPRVARGTIRVKSGLTNGGTLLVRDLHVLLWADGPVRNMGLIDLGASTLYVRTPSFVHEGVVHMDGTSRRRLLVAAGAVGGAIGAGVGESVARATGSGVRGELAGIVAAGVAAGQCYGTKDGGEAAAAGQAIAQAARGATISVTRNFKAHQGQARNLKAHQGQPRGIGDVDDDDEEDAADLFSEWDSSRGRVVYKDPDDEEETYVIAVIGDGRTPFGPAVAAAEQTSKTETKTETKTAPKTKTQLRVGRQPTRAYMSKGRRDPPRRAMSGPNLRREPATGAAVRSPMKVGTLGHGVKMDTAPMATLTSAAGAGPSPSPGPSPEPGLVEPRRTSYLAEVRQGGLVVASTLAGQVDIPARGEDAYVASKLGCAEAIIGRPLQPAEKALLRSTYTEHYDEDCIAALQVRGMIFVDALRDPVTVVKGVMGLLFENEAEAAGALVSDLRDAKTSITKFLPRS